MKNFILFFSLLCALAFQAQAANNFAKDQLVAWCIVPFDAAKRGPLARAEMLKRLGLKRVAYDWREQHVKEFEEEILVNIGSENGVRIGDKFKVHAVGLGLHDPITGSDLGDIYVRTGVIQILHAWEGISRARSVGGKNFKTGFLVQSLSNGKFPSREKVPWWEFHGIRAVDGQE